MKKCKRVLIIAMAVVMLIFAMAISASAETEVDTRTNNMSEAERIGFEFTPDDGVSYPIADTELMAAEDLDELAEIVWSRFIADEKNLSQDMVESTQLILQEYGETIIQHNAIASANSIEITKSTLAAYLCAIDGVSVSNLNTAKNLADTALTNASARFDENDPMHDSYRHFTWNHTMTSQISKSVARTVSVDYELASIVLPDVQNKYYELFNSYISSGSMDAATATAAAYSAALSYGATLRDNMISVCQQSQSKFSSYFNKASVRDLWNNCYGRAYAEKDAVHGAALAFIMANLNGDLINSDGAVTNDHIYSVWAWNWYTP